MTFLAGYFVLGRGDTKSLSVGCERSHSGATTKAGMAKVSSLDDSGGDIIPASMFDGDNRPDESRNGINIVEV